MYFIKKLLNIMKKNQISIYDDIEEEINFLLQNFRMDGLIPVNMNESELKELISNYEDRITIIDLEKSEEVYSCFLHINYKLKDSKNHNIDDNNLYTRVTL